MNVIHIVADTLRRDHCGPWHRGRPIRDLGDLEQPDWTVPTPNMDRLAARGTIFDQAWCGSHPCMPARRDLYTGRLEFPWRGWGPLEDDDDDLPRRISGPPNHSLHKYDRHVSQLITDHFHLWEQGSGNYHMGFSGFEFIRGMEADNWRTDPLDAPMPTEATRTSKLERHYRNLAAMQQDAGPSGTVASFPERTFGAAADWLDRNHEWTDFYLHIDSFPPHEPWDPPERLLKRFDERGYDVPEWYAFAPYAPIEISGLSNDQVRHTQALYAASVMHVDEALGLVLDSMDRHNLWETTLVIFTTDHGTWNGSRRRMGKLQTHLHTPIAQIPMIVAHPTLAHGERRSQVVQLIDCYPTVLDALGEPIPDEIHGRSLLPTLENAAAPGHDVAISGIFGEGMTVTDGAWTLHLAPVEGNQPLYWYSYHQSRFFPYDLGDYRCLEVGGGRRPVDHTPMEQGIWLSNLAEDPYEYENLVDIHPEQVRRLARLLQNRLREICAPPEQIERLRIDTLVDSKALT